MGFPARPFVPAEGATQSHGATPGTEKTITAAASALKFLPQDRILVMVPTLALIVQSTQSWRWVGHRAPMAAVCSVDNSA
jgi:superfamily II DNA or RNA helicase